MFARLILAVLLLAPATTFAAGPSPDWTPFHAYIGTWQGKRASPMGEISVRRTYQTGEGSGRIQVNEAMGSGDTPWGVVSYDAERGFVLKRFVDDGEVSEFVLAGASDPKDGLTFVGSPAGKTAPVSRITHHRNGWNDFVELVETSTDGKEFSLVSETRFHRK